MSRDQKCIVQIVVTIVLLLMGINQTVEFNKKASSQDVADHNVASVLRAIDGDTIQITDQKTGEKTTVRLIGVNTPETVDPRKPVQCFGKEASDFVKKGVAKTASQNFRLEKDETQGEFDKYGRILAYLYIGSSTKSLNQEIIEQGYGHEYTYKIPYKYQSDFKEAERRARLEKRGLWADGVCYTDEHVRNP